MGKQLARKVLKGNLTCEGMGGQTDPPIPSQANLNGAVQACIRARISNSTAKYSLITVEIASPLGEQNCFWLLEKGVQSLLVRS